MKKPLELLYRSFDTNLPQQEKDMLDKVLSQSDELLREKILIEDLRRAISQLSIEDFKPFFAERVISRIEHKKTQSEAFFSSLCRSFKWAIIPSLAIVIAILVSNILSADEFSIGGAFGFPQVTIEDVLQPQTDMILVDGS